MKKKINHISDYYYHSVYSSVTIYDPTATKVSKTFLPGYSNMTLLLALYLVISVYNPGPRLATF